ncbi:MAG: hypothetical protein LKF38_01205 [Bifidobacterium sp.]|nr:hypothetical protein [Bifidobacterium sp.]
MGRLFAGCSQWNVIRMWLVAVSSMVVVALVALAALAVPPVERAVAAEVDYGPDGYFSTLSNGALPVVSNGWINTRRILLGKTDNSVTSGGAEVSGGYKTLAKGEVASEVGRSFNTATIPTNDWSASSTTSVASNEALLWADDVVTGGFAFDLDGSPWTNDFDSGDVSSGYKSGAAVMSVSVAENNYSDIEQMMLRLATVEGVCTDGVGCSSGDELNSPASSVNEYQIFPLSIGDVNKYLGHTNGYSTDDNLRCKTNIDNGNSGNCANDVSGSWLRSGIRSYSDLAFYVRNIGYPSNSNTSIPNYGLRPALRLKLDDLLLSADSGDQSQSVSGDLRLTVVESGKRLSMWSASVSGGVGSRMLSLFGGSDLDVQSGLGWKVVDPESNTVLGSGRTSAGGNMALPESKMTDESKEYDLYVWGQQDGNATDGLTNKATEPVKTTITNWKVKLPDVPVSGDGRLGQVGVGDHSVNVTGQIDSAVVVTLPAGLVLDGYEAGGVSRWVGDNANVQVNTALVESSERVVVRLKNISGVPLRVASGGYWLDYELRVNQQAALSSQSGDLLVAASSLDAPVSATLQGRFTGGVVPQDAQSGNYRGQLTFQVAVEEKP